MYLCMQAYIYVLMYLQMYACLHDIHTYAFTYVCMNVYMYAHMYIDLHACMYGESKCMCLYVGTYTYTCI